MIWNDEEREHVDGIYLRWVGALVIVFVGLVLLYYRLGELM